MHKHYIYIYIGRVIVLENMLSVWTDNCIHVLCGCDDLQRQNVCTLSTHTHTGGVKYVTQFGLTSSWKVKHPLCTLLASSQDHTITEWGFANEQVMWWGYTLYMVHNTVYVVYSVYSRCVLLYMVLPLLPLMDPFWLDVYIFGRWSTQP